MTRLRDDRGTVLLEFVIVGTAVIMLIMGGMEFGRGLTTFLALTNAARDGARYRVLPGVTDDPARCWTVLSAPGYASSGPDPCQPGLPQAEGNRCILRIEDVTVTPGSTPEGDSMVTVEILYHHGLFFVPVPGITDPSPSADCLGRPRLPLQVSVSMRAE